MVSRTAAEQAIRKHTQGSTLKGLLGFLQDQSDDQLSQWIIRDVHGDEAIFAYFRLRAARDGNISLHTDQGDGDQLVASVACWWPACWLKSVVSMWQVREDEGSRQQQQEQQQHQNACTCPLLQPRTRRPWTTRTLLPPPALASAPAASSLPPPSTCPPAVSAAHNVPVPNNRRWACPSPAGADTTSANQEQQGEVCSAGAQAGVVAGLAGVQRRSGRPSPLMLAGFIIRFGQ